MAQVPLIRQNQAANAHIDGATPSYLARTWPKNSGRKWTLFFGQTWAQHRLNKEGYVGLLGALLAAFGPKKNHRPKIFSVGFFFWVGFGLMLGHLEVMLGLCWAILGLCWAFVGSFGVLLAAFGPKKHFPTENFSVGKYFGSVLGLCWAIWRLCWASVGPF